MRESGGCILMDHDSKSEDTHRAAGPDNPPSEPLNVGSGRTRVNLELKYQGLDILLLVTGGKAHIGAVAVWNGQGQEGPVVVTELPGHREGPLAGECAEILGRASGRVVVTVVGIHQDRATREEIAAIVANVRQGASELAKVFERTKGTSDD